MKLKRLRVENFKRFRAPLELRDLTDGLNLFVAPNEAGKSTVAEAIRAAFFERHKSSSVGGLRPWSDSSATPTVEIEFELGGKPARLIKAFLGKKRCELSIDGKVLDGTAAEDHLGELLGFSFAGRGGSSPEHMAFQGCSGSGKERHTKSPKRLALPAVTCGTRWEKSATSRVMKQ